MEGHADDTDFAGDAFGSPAEIAGFKAEAAVFGVAAPGADEMDGFAADTGVGGLTALLEGSVGLSDWLLEVGGFLVVCIPLLAVVGTLCTGGGALVTGVS